MQAQQGLRHELVPDVKKATVRIGILNRNTGKLYRQSCIMATRASMIVGQVLTCAHAFTEPNPNSPHFKEPFWTWQQGMAHPEQIPWQDAGAPLLIMVGVYDSSEQASRWAYWAELITPLATVKELTASPHAPHPETQLLDLAVIRICGSLDVTPLRFGTTADVYTVNAKHASILPVDTLPSGRPLGNPDVLSSGEDKITIYGWSSPHGETFMQTPDPSGILGISKGLLMSQALLHSGSSGGPAVDGEGRVVAVNSMSVLPTGQVDPNYKAYHRMVSLLRPEHGLA